MAGAGVTQSVCLPLLSVYQLSTNGAIQVGAASFIPAGNAPGGLLLPSQTVAGGCQNGVEGKESLIFVCDLFRPLLHPGSPWTPPPGPGCIGSPCP